MKRRNLAVAMSQFPVTTDVCRNARFIKRHIRRAAGDGADAILFPEGALSGYGRSTLSFRNYDWALLRKETDAIISIARECGIWVFLGSAHFLSESEGPTNCLYIISPQGQIVDRYDKSMLIGHELERYSGGKHPVVIDLDGWKCGFAICYDSNFPELFGRYRSMGVEIVFLAVNCAGAAELSPHVKLLSELVPAQFRTRATRRHQAGIIHHKLPDNDLGMLYNDKVMTLSKDEVFHNGIVSSHKRARNRQSMP
jgi:predicted amidohydrolase